MTEEEMKKALEKALGDIESLKETNKALKAEKTEAKRKADEAEAARDEVAEQAAAKAGDIEALKASMQRKHDAELKRLTDQVEAGNKRLGELLIDNSIKDAITTNKVLPHYAKAVEAMLRAGAKIENGEAVTADGTPLSDANAAFFKSADAKHFVEAPHNSGGGAQGSTAKAGALTKAPETAEEYNAFMRLSSENRDQANALAEQWQRPDLKS